MPADATWRQAGVRTQALDVERQQLGQCPYPLRLTLLRWQAKDEFQHSTLISFSDAEQLPTADLFPTYHQRQDVEAGIKQGKGTLPLFQAWQYLWPVSSESVKEQVSALMADKVPLALTEALFAQLGARSPEKVEKIRLDKRLAL